MSTPDRTGIRGILELTDDIAGWVILAHNVVRVLHGIHESDQWIKVG